MQERYPYGFIAPDRVADLLRNPNYLARQALDQLFVEIDSLKQSGVDTGRLETLVASCYTPCKTALYQTLLGDEQGYSIFEIQVADMVVAGEAQISQDGN